ncbi:phosphatidylserine decarboxylase proenzyme 2-like [Syzygium oleosum]|uniref:phosphatidylserine decarboxylase proenzyme 2-like n=1 Tax=Syzygium oleosum TaxID=219896 RepID=UPI0024BA3F7C|nr:phosphatidylserine decarboxylase proenzyme 2-like [Syzygium oleosum]XP_056159325.1 phosphatidylserine decarboxylase proenzyme 2-like [Syzygium oleosum]XP_056159326.1 phosphatidylserine decarboxylase proenzyme 2-like [Syzygium oleosum]XP_056159327.1 phosphatidylserine decarboxylase proenzyme 2-like [Syzygium oleosum]XP_056159328.1 phosphatidylserine decarboxylase proenzyme 2-like [Syzygium oleosum]XP_056159329.1 phosphatidylserine decarboxylase proenzyme 2-like [Syzygium oleosum]
MGNGSSRDGDGDGDGGSSSGRMSRFRQRLRFHHRGRHGRHDSGSASFLKSADDFAGIALLTLRSAEMEFKDRWRACVSFGEQTFRTAISDHTDKPTWNAEKKLLLERNGPHIARISVFETNRISKNNLVGYCELDLLEVLAKDSESDSEVLNLLDPSKSDEVVGTLLVSCSVEDPVETQKSFARRILSIVDYNEDGKLSFSEFSDLMHAFGNQLAANKKEELFKAADVNGDGVVSMDELAVLLATQQEKEPVMNCCPVCGEVLNVSDKLNTVVHLTLCFDEGSGHQVMTGGFLTDKQASSGWMFKLSEWAHFSSYDIGLNYGSSASNIVVFDRRTKRLVEEIIDGKIVLSMRAIYQSKFGLGLIDTGAKEILQSISEKQGRKMNSVESAEDIPKFLNFFKDQINIAEVKYPLEHFKTFNEFFIRELKPGARPIASVEHDNIAVCAADSRLMAFNNVEDSTRFWVKGKKFSIQGLLGNEISSSSFEGGALVIFRLAPQDYHRFHLPVTGIIEQFVNIPGCLFTVNPIAVNSKYCNVFTENKRVVSIISTEHFGKVAFIAIGATMVGTITFLKQEGERVKKGDEFGYFSFGGSTVICVFEKDVIDIDKDLLENSSRSLETLVSVGMKLGVSTRKQAETGIPNLEKMVLEA